MAEEGPSAAQVAAAFEKKLQFLELRLMAGFGVKLGLSEKFSKQFRTEENVAVVREFLDGTDVVTCFFSQAAQDVVVASITPPKTIRKKGLIFYKVNKSVHLTPDNIRDELVTVEMTKEILELLLGVSQEVLMPIFSNPSNQEGWSEVITHDLMEKFHAVISHTFITIGKTKGRVFLPPPAEEPVATVNATDALASQKDKVHALESAVITWTKQIKAILRQQPEEVLKGGENPGPFEEIQFWKTRSENLNSINDQLASERIKKAVRYLEQHKSSYVSPFQKLEKEVATAQAEANENCRFLKGLVVHLKNLSNETKEFPELEAYFVPLMHTISLIWKNSSTYCIPSRLVVLLQEISNQLIVQATRFVNGQQIFSLIEAEDASEAVDRLKKTLKILGSFKSSYFEYRNRIAAELPNNSWKFQNTAVFGRLDSFMERCHDILDLTLTIMQFDKLAKIEVGGTKGKTLTTSVLQIHAEFVQALTQFKNVPYDVMSVDAKNFDDDFYAFRVRMKELERRVASVLTQGFDDCATITSRFKLLDSFEGLLERPLIEDELEKKHTSLIAAYTADLKETQEIFMNQRSNPPVFSNLPPVMGAIKWSRSLFTRIEEPMEKLRKLNKGATEKEEFKEAEKLYETLRSGIEAFERGHLEEFAKDIETSSRDKLKQPLLVRDPQTQLLKVNFHPSLVRYLREAKYLELLDLDLVASLKEIYLSRELYRTQTGNLDLIVNMYNNMLTSLLDVEKPLLQSRIDKIDGVLQEGLSALTWRSSGINDFIKSAMAITSETNSVLRVLKQNLKQIQSIVKGWADKPLLERKSKPLLVDDFVAMHKELVTKRQGEVGDSGREIHRLMKEVSDILKVGKGLPTWKAYVDYVSVIVLQGFVRMVVVSLQFLKDQINPEVISKQDLPPMFDIKLDLLGNQVCYEPSVGEAWGKNKGISDIMHGWIEDFFHTCSVMVRLDTNSGDYLEEVRENNDIKVLLKDLQELEQQTVEECQKLRDSYLEYKYLWNKEIDVAFAEFLKSCTKKDDRSQYDMDNEDVFDSNKRKSEMLNLSVFDDRITYFRQQQNQISELKASVDIRWLRINAQPVKLALNTLVSKWTNQFTQYLTEFSAQKLSTLNNFMSTVNTGLKHDVHRPDSKGKLMEIMTYIRDVRIKIEETKEMFQPLRDTIALLKKHGVLVSESILFDLETAPAKWDETVKSAFDVKGQILSLQSEEADNLRKRLEEFSGKVQQFRDEFAAKAPFNDDWDVDDAYSQINHYQLKLVQIESEAKEFNNLEELFELQKSDFKALRLCRKELRWLKLLWDMFAMIGYTYDDWKSIMWDKIDTDKLLEENKIVTNQVKNLPKEMRSWRAYLALQDKVKNMTVVLPLIYDLHSESMRERHWKALMSITGKVINFKNLSLEDMINLQLHKFAEDVADIVDVSVKEAKIEKKLETIESTWERQTLRFESYKDTSLLQSLDEIIEILEQHSMDLMAMSGQGKFVESFKDRVGRWLKSLRKVDTVLDLWVKVQKNWKRLETIFLGVQDIRSQLPEDTKRFEELDEKWKDLMKEAQFLPDVVKACEKEGREELLRHMHQTIERCEKALNDYLEQKKKMFPRFYFVSNHALLDILSNGNNPKRVCEYIGDCFDGIGNLAFDEENVPEGQSSKIAKGMYSKDKEYVPFTEGDFTAEGPVESWLNGLEAKMRSTLRDILESAKSATDNWEVDRPREEWLKDYNAQIALVASQVVWTEEVTQAFDELEGGNENAMKDYKRVCDDRIEKLIKLVQGELPYDLRVKIMTIITIDVHSRDVVETLVNKKCTDINSFAWQCQLRFYWSQPQGSDQKTCVIRICDWQTTYLYEYVGNCGRLVITPLTDRCYITLTQALNLIMGGAPAGPAGTGKTETTKDLGRALGRSVYVFNCSEQMNYQTMAQIFMGLAQTGMWGCFDEFNRISIEVLSVVSTQVKSILDAIKAKKTVFQFMDDEIALKNTCGFYITMNPGYAGRTELPENLKALFRSCAMVVPDLVLICENMLMAEGFVRARMLAKKFVTLYGLCKELLSKQMHYDWGLRAVKSVLRVAGMLKRADPNIDEDPILMRALRDFNKPKIVADDRPIFFRLIEDLFPGMQLEPKVDKEFEAIVKEVTAAKGLQEEDGFVLKVVQLRDILQVRHCAFVMGPPGCGKTTVWETLCRALRRKGEETATETINPKAVTSNELFGYMTRTKEWKDGVLSTVMRNMCKELPPYKASQKHKYIVLDGDIDPEWIESLNTVMDDNKVLTLVSNERIPLTESMRLLFEISNLRNATPATVSRAGVLFINETDVGWQPFVESWISAPKLSAPGSTVRESDHKTDENVKSTLYLLFSQYVDSNIEHVRRHFKHIVPTVEISMVQTVCYSMDALLMKYADQVKNASLEEQKVIIEAFFIFACMWAFGGALAEDKVVNYRNNFSSYWRSVAKIKFPENGLCFDYYYDPNKSAWVSWQDNVPSLSFSPEDLAPSTYTSLLVPTIDTVRIKFLLHILVQQKRPVLFVGGAGSGKTLIVRDYLNGLNQEEMLSCTVNFNNYTDSYTLQQILEQVVEKRTGKTFGPAGNKRLIYFIDDLNMPFVDKYGTQTPIALIRQLIDYRSIFDRSALDTKKEIQDTQFVAAMNPKAGSFYIDARLQRHFASLSILLPNADTLQSIFKSILDCHLATFDSSVSKISENIVQATVEVFRAVSESSQFLPSAKKFHYQFNLRDLNAVMQGLLQAQSGMYKGSPVKLIRLWLHECYRVFHDRLINENDIATMQDIIINASRKYFEDSQELIHEQPLVFTSFVSSHLGNDAAYIPVRDSAQLKKVLEEKLTEYNENNAMMDLVLFDMAIDHICRIARILERPSGNCLLIGVGGSGKQSLSRLASFILKYEVVQLMVHQTYGLSELKADLQELYKKAAVKPGEPLSFLLTDAQIINERFLVYINDLLASGYIPDLFAKEEVDGLLSSIRNEAKAAGIPDSRDAMQAFFYQKVKRNLHVILCMSPAGDTLRIRARKFPALINCTAIDWFHAWPRDALVDVASRFLSNVEDITPELREAVSQHMSEVHLSINEANQKYLSLERRYNYTTPKSFLELIDFYKKLLANKRDKIQKQISRLETGLSTLQNTKNKVEELKLDLQLKLVQVQEKKVATDELIEQMGKASAVAEEEAKISQEEEKKTQALASEAQAIQFEANTELEQATPALEKAKDAVNCLERNSITELKSFPKPAIECLDVTEAIMRLVFRETNPRKLDWKSAQQMMANPQKFKETLEQFNAESIDENILASLEPILNKKHFNFETMKGKSVAAAFLCNWVVNIVTYNKIYKNVRPLMDRLAQANENNAKAEHALEIARRRAREVEEKLQSLRESLIKAETEKARVEAEARESQNLLDVAERLVGGLADEFTRWGENVSTLKVDQTSVVGDALLSSAFVSYIGAFSAAFRSSLWQEKWMPDLIAKDIPISKGVDPLKVLASDADQAKWKNEGLPADRVSLENAAVITSCQRWPLMIDPQLQGIKWIKQREGEQLTIIQLTMPKWLKQLETAITLGRSMLIENITEHLEPVLDPVLTRSTYKRGRNTLLIKLGGEELEYDTSFRLILQTKLANPHYKPEIAAQCTLINFTVTESGLEDQLLAMVVNKEKPELEAQKQELVRKQNEYKVTLSQLEDELLQRLSDADPATILHNIPLIEGLENTKKTSMEIKEQVAKAIETEEIINKNREVYRNVAAEGALEYFLLIQLNIIDHMYQYSLDSFIKFFFKAMDRTPEIANQAERVLALRDSIRMTVFTWVSRGLFEKHKLIFSAQLCFRLMQKKMLEAEEFSTDYLQFLLRGEIKEGTENPLDWLPTPAWNAVQSLISLEEFSDFANNMVKDAPTRFKEWYNELAPEKVKLPLDWKRLDNEPFKKMMVIRCLRPDRITAALTDFVRSTLPRGNEFIDVDSSLSFREVLESSISDSTPHIPLFFILSPGADPAKEVETIARKRQFMPNEKYFNVALGQGQDVVAMKHLEKGQQEGHWIMLQNIHLMPTWLIELEKKLDEFEAKGSHPDFRLFLSAEPSNDIPIGILERSIKMTNEPPSGLKANLKRAFTLFTREEVEEKDSKLKAILFGLCHFHAIMLERKKFGPLGYNMQYPFSMGDLRDSAAVLVNYLEINSPTKIPWDDLRYLFGEIMYGGHIVDDWDRKLCKNYLEFYMVDELLEEKELFPYADGKEFVYKAPPTLTYDQYVAHLGTLPTENPIAFGLHPNAEIGFRTSQSNYVLQTIFELQPRDASSAGGEGGVSLMVRAEAVVHNIMDDFKDLNFDLDDIASRIPDEERGPYQNVFMQECEMMNTLLHEMVRSLDELDLGFKGELTMSDQMESLISSLFLDRVPASWAKLAFPSQRALGSWILNLLARIKQLQEWASDPTVVPKVVHVNLLFNPQSFLTAIKQVTAQKHALELDKLMIVTEVTKRAGPEAVDSASRDGVYVFGLCLEGARWDVSNSQLEESKPREMVCPMPIVNCRAQLVTAADAREDKSIFQCPVYKTQQRGPTFVFTAQLKTRAPPSKWVLAGVAVVMDVI